MKALIAFFHFLVYHHVWIAFAALGMYWQTHILAGQAPEWTPVSGFLFFGTMALYGSHRLIGLQRMGDGGAVGRFLLIRRHMKAVLLITLLSAFLSSWFFLEMQAIARIWLLPAILCSAAYVSPIFGKGRRLRDFPFIKIFLIALVWSWYTVSVPIAVNGIFPFPAGGLVFLERTLFLFAITLPFDLRDLELDEREGVVTLAQRIGRKNTVSLGLASLLLASLLAVMSWWIGSYTPVGLAALLTSFLVSGFFVWNSREKESDLYFSGLLDGTMILQFLLVWLSS